MAAIQVKVMKALDEHWRNPFVHSYLWLQDREGDRWVVEGYPEIAAGKKWLKAFIYEGDIGHYGLSQGRDQRCAWTYVGAEPAAAVDRLLAAARAFPSCAVPYRMVRGPNSNSFIRYLSTKARVAIPRPDFALGWDADLLGE